MHDLGESPPSALFRRYDIVTDETVADEPERFSIISYLGKGGFAQCYSATSLKHGDNVALKIVDKYKLQDTSYTKMKREINIHRNALHKNIVRLFGSFECHTYFYLVLELCNAQSLLAIINQAHVCPGYMELNLVRKYLRGVLSAVDYLLERCILHRDIKPGNIFIGMDSEVKLGDFGLAIEMKDLHKASVSGTPNYLAPEILLRRGHSEYSEVWSIGCLLYCMMDGRPPFETESIDKTYLRISRGNFVITPNIRADSAVEKIICQCLSVTPNMRPRVSDLMNHPWVNSIVPLNNNKVKSQPRYNRGTLSTPQSLVRARSVGDILRDPNGNISLRHSRPKSTGVPDQSCMSDKSRRKSITGSHDSGFGSEVDMSKRPALSDRVSSILDDLKSLFEKKSFMYPCTFPVIYIAKWVDYSNRRGFACKLSNGTISVKFNEGSCISIPQESDYIVHAGSPFSIPKLLDLRDYRTSAEMELLNTAFSYGRYMDNELAGGPIVPYPTPTVMDIPYLVFHHLTVDHLLVVLSNGTVQVNLLKEKIKIVMWKDDSVSGSPCYISFLIHGYDMQSFCIHSQPNITPMENPGNPHLQDYLHYITAIISSQCDFLSHKKPTMSTEC